MNKLFAIYMGGAHKGANIEVHDILFAAAEDVKSAIPSLKKKWFGDLGSAHIDSWTELSQVENYEINLQKSPPKSGPKLFFVNVGYYQEGIFSEQHRFHFLVALDKTDAKKKAKKLYAKEVHLPHVDQLLDVEDLIQLREIDGHFVHLNKTSATRELKVENIYWPLKRG